MIIKGKSRASARSLGNYLSSQGQNERIQIIEVRGTVARDPFGAIVEMDAYGAGTKCEKPLYHAMINPQPPHVLTPAQRLEAVDALEKKVGLVGHARVVVAHVKDDREHTHIVWSRINLETMKTVSDSHNYRKHEECARDLERRFGHERIQGAHHERESVERPARTPSRSDLRQEQRTGITGKRVSREVTLAFQASDSPEALKAALEERGYKLALGDRRDFVVVDPKGGIHNLARRIEGVKAADLREFMSTIDSGRLPKIGELQATIQAQRRVNEETARRFDETKLEKAYGRGGGYVSQTQAAQKDFRKRQHRLNDATSRDGPDKQQEAPGAGHTRSR